MKGPSEECMCHLITQFSYEGRCHGNSVSVWVEPSPKDSRRIHVDEEHLTITYVAFISHDILTDFQALKSWCDFCGSKMQCIHSPGQRSDFLSNRYVDTDATAAITSESQCHALFSLIL